MTGSRRFDDEVRKGGKAREGCFVLAGEMRSRIGISVCQSHDTWTHRRLEATYRERRSVDNR